MDTVYRVIERKGEKTEYGIEISRQIHGIFFEKSEAEEFVRLCNEMDVSCVHIEDIIHDRLLEREYTHKQNGEE